MSRTARVEYTGPKTNSRYIIISAAAVFLTWTLHELAHWITGESLGYEMGMTLNASYPLGGQYASNWHYQLITAAGPAFTLLQAAFVFVLMSRKNRASLYPFIFTCFYMRLFASILSFGNPNDEARISSFLGIGKFTLPFMVTSLLFLLVLRISKTYRFNARFNLFNLGLVVLFSSIIILADLYFKWRLI